MPNHGGLQEQEFDRAERIGADGMAQAAITVGALISLRAYEQWVHEIWVDSADQMQPSLARDYEQLRGLFIACTGLPGELGELLEPVKKAIRKRVTVDQLPEHLGPEGRKALANEIGDVIYYLTRVAKTCGFTLQDAIDANVEKLVVRYDAHKPGELPRR